MICRPTGQASELKPRLKLIAVMDSQVVNWNTVNENFSLAKQGQVPA